MSTAEQKEAQAGTTSGGSLLDEILAETKIKPSDDAYAIAKRGVQAFIAEMLGPTHTAERIDKTAVDAMIADIDRRSSAQLNEILHHPDFQKLESAWRGPSTRISTARWPSAAWRAGTRRWRCGASRASCRCCAKPPRRPAA